MWKFITHIIFKHTLIHKLGEVCKKRSKLNSPEVIGSMIFFFVCLFLKAHTLEVDKQTTLRHYLSLKEVLFFFFRLFFCPLISFLLSESTCLDCIILVLLFQFYVYFDNSGLILQTECFNDFIQLL